MNVKTLSITQFLIFCLFFFHFTYDRYPMQSVTKVFFLIRKIDKKNTNKYFFQDNLRRFKKVHYQITRHEDIIQFFANFEDFLTEDEMWNISETIKPRGQNKSKWHRFSSIRPKFRPKDWYLYTEKGGGGGY